MTIPGSVCAPEVLVLLSGGIDSAACVAFYLEIGRPIGAVFVDYGQASVAVEARSANAVATHYGIPLMTMRWKGLTQKTDGEVLGRNAFLLTAALMERPVSVTGVAIGIHTGTCYSDCSAEFVHRMQALFDLYCDRSVRVIAPFLDWSKADVFEFCRMRHVPVELTYSCERGVQPQCGQCLSSNSQRRIG